MFNYEFKGLRRFLLLFVLGCALTVHSQNSKWEIYPSLGIDMGGAVPFPLSDIPDGAKGTPKLLPNIGLGYEYHVLNKISVGIECNYHTLAFSSKADVRSQPFYSDNRQNILYFSGKTSADVELRFLEFPLVLNYTINPNFTLEAGTYYSRILDGSFNTKGTDGILSDNKAITDTASLPGIANTSYNFNDNLDKWDAGLLIGYRYNLNHKIFFWSRLQVGFKSIFVKEFENIDYEMYQVRLVVGVSVILLNKQQSSSENKQ